MDVDGGGDADVGVAEEFLDHDEFDPLFQEQGRGRVPEVVKADATKAGLAEEREEGAGEVGRVDRSALRGGEHVPVVLPCGACGLMLALLLFVVELQRLDAAGGEGDAALGGPRLGGQRGEPACGGSLKGPVTATAAEVPRPALGVAPGSQILSAGTTGFLTAGADDTLRWTRYADGTTTGLGKAKEHNTAVNGSVSDTVVTGDDPGSTRASDKITMRNMATGDSTVLDLAARGYHYSGTVGDTGIVHKRVGDSYEVHLLTQTEGTLNDRVVTGLPGSVEDVKTAAGAPGVALLGFTKRFHHGIADRSMMTAWAVARSTVA